MTDQETEEANDRKWDREVQRLRAENERLRWLQNGLRTAWNEQFRAGHSARSQARELAKALERCMPYVVAKKDDSDHARHAYEKANEAHARYYATQIEGAEPSGPKGEHPFQDYGGPAHAGEPDAPVNPFGSGGPDWHPSAGYEPEEDEGYPEPECTCDTESLFPGGAQGANPDPCPVHEPDVPEGSPSE